MDETSTLLPYLPCPSILQQHIIMSRGLTFLGECRRLLTNFKARTLTVHKLISCLELIFTLLPYLPCPSILQQHIIMPQGLIIKRGLTFGRMQKIINQWHLKAIWIKLSVSNTISRKFTILIFLRLSASQNISTQIQYHNGKAHELYLIQKHIHTHVAVSWYNFTAAMHNMQIKSQCSTTVTVRTSWV